MRHDVGKVYVQFFDVTLEAYFGRHLLCIHAPTCGYGPALEHNGDLYSCDHFVEPRFRLGNIHETHMLKLVSSAEQRKFGDDKRDTLTAQCKSCEVRPLCNGGCPKDRFALSRDGEPGQNYLCAGPRTVLQAHRSRRCEPWRNCCSSGGRPPTLWKSRPQSDKLARHQPCPCGSGRKLRQCHGNESPEFPFSHVSLAEDQSAEANGAAMIGTASLVMEPLVEKGAAS